MSSTRRQWSRKLETRIPPFRASFPDVHMEIIDLIAEDHRGVGRFTCSATHLGE